MSSTTTNQKESKWKKSEFLYFEFFFSSELIWRKEESSFWFKENLNPQEWEIKAENIDSALLQRKKKLGS